MNEQTEEQAERDLEAIAMNIVHQIGDALYEALPHEVAHDYFVDARQATNDKAIDFVKKLIAAHDAKQKAEWEKEASFEFELTYWYQDKTGYYFDTRPRRKCSVKAKNQDEALKKARIALPPNDDGRDFTLRLRVDGFRELAHLTK